MPKVKFLISVETGKRTPIKLQGYYYGNNKPVSFKKGKTYLKSEVLLALLKVLEDSFIEADHEVIRTNKDHLREQK